LYVILKGKVGVVIGKNLFYIIPYGRGEGVGVRTYNKVPVKLQFLIKISYRFKR